jgi:periplasmic divalent cation tolerance protein
MARPALTEYVQVLTTVSSKEEAERVCSTLIEQRLAACVQILGPIASRYRWKGEIEEAQEWQCLAKTEGARYGEVEEAIRQAHSYEEPEILAIPILTGSKGYLDWIAASLRE